MFRQSKKLARAFPHLRAASSLATPQPAAASSSSSATTTTTPFATSNVTTDPSLLPKAGETFFSPYDALSAVNPAATPRPIWDTGIKESSHFADGKVPDLWSIEYLWEKLDQDTRDRTIAHLTERSQGDWKDLSLVEKKALWYVNYGPWGKRAPQLAHGDGWDVLLLFGAGIGGSMMLWTLFRLLTPPTTKTLDIEWQRKTNEYMRSRNMNPITGISSENYGGTGLIQSTSFFGAPKVY